MASFLIMKEKWNIMICIQLVLYDTNSLIYQNKAMKENMFMRLHKISITLRSLLDSETHV